MGKKLKPVPEGNKGLKKLPTEVRNKMGFMKKGGQVTTQKKKTKITFQVMVQNIKKIKLQNLVKDLVVLKKKRIPKKNLKKKFKVMLINLINH